MAIQQFSFKNTPIADLKIVTPFVADDERGYLSKTFETGIFRSSGIEMEPYEELQSFSKKGTVRGLHFQRRYSQDKLVRVLHGAVFDVGVDLREGSPTFGQWEGVYLSAENRKMLYIPKGFAHGFIALEEDTLFSYLCGDRYDPESDGGIFWQDPELKVAWPVEKISAPILSKKDQSLQSFDHFKKTVGGL